MRCTLLKRCRSLFRLCPFLVVACLLALSADSVLAAEGRIAFTSNRDGGTEAIYIMDADGGNPFKITEGTNQPAWLPNGGESIGFHLPNDDRVGHQRQRYKLCVNITKGINQ